MDLEARCAAMREALQAALQSHVKLGKAYRCDCSLCIQIRASLEPEGGVEFADRVRAECAQVADWKLSQLRSELATASNQTAEPIKTAMQAVREVADRIRVLMNRRY
jgi:hypothetical protein